jgi:hypothetical protein
MSESGMYHGASTMMRKTLDWNRSRISMLEVKAVPHSCIPHAYSIKHRTTLLYASKERAVFVFSIEFEAFMYLWKCGNCLRG